MCRVKLEALLDTLKDLRAMLASIIHFSANEITHPYRDEFAALLADTLQAQINAENYVLYMISMDVSTMMSLEIASKHNAWLTDLRQTYAKLAFDPECN